MSEEDDLPRLLNGRYRLEATLGHGGMGVVYRGVDLMMRRPIAVKLVRGVDGMELDDEIAGRFLREAKNTARLQHEHIIEVFDLGRTEEGGLYFVMELLEGASLSARLRRDGKFSPSATVHIGRQICEALQVAHTVGVIHRDLKPANIMLLSRAGDDDFVKVLDFGVAKSLNGGDQETQLTHTGMLVGTVDYMAPEQIMGKPVDGRTDIYALGVVLYKMLSGKAPFRDTGVPALIHAHLNTMPKPLIEVVAGVPNELDHVVLRCLAKLPERRFESMAELARALSHAMMPADGLIDLEYVGGGDDVYDDGDETEIVRSVFDPVPRDGATVNERVRGPIVFDDATVKIERPPGMTPRVAPPHRPPSAPIAGAIGRVEGVGHPHAALESRTCAMCQTVNAPYGLSCVACGVSLSSVDQAAVRARMHTDTVRTVSAQPPSMPPEVPVRMPAPPPYPPFGASPPRDMPAAQWPTPPPPLQAPSLSMWQRFLSWTGLRSR